VLSLYSPEPFSSSDERQCRTQLAEILDSIEASSPGTTGNLTFQAAQ
jgi:hypothetical protein